jgi:pimeloyl-ACP methyl ester carboxylesterase
MAVAIARPKLEGNIAVGDDRQIGFAEFGDPQGRAIFWLHGTPGARRQIPMEARVCAAQRRIRLIGIDRPGIGSSTPYQYDTVFAFAEDLRTIADTLGIDKFEVIGLSGGGPYALACAAAMSDRVVAAGVLGGVAPTSGSDAIGGGVSTLVKVAAPVIGVAGAPIRLAASGLIRLIRPVAEPALYAYARISPEADRRLLVRPEFKAMFLDDLLKRQPQATRCAVRRRRGVRPRLGLPPRRGQGAGPLVARRPRPHRPVRARTTRGVQTARRPADPPAGRKSPGRIR